MLHFITNVQGSTMTKNLKDDQELILTPSATKSTAIANIDDAQLSSDYRPTTVISSRHLQLARDIAKCERLLARRKADKLKASQSAHVPNIIESIQSTRRRLNDFYANSGFTSLLLFSILGNAIHTSYASAGAAILKSQDHSYSIQESALAVFIGSALLNPLGIFIERAFARMENLPVQYQYALEVMRWPVFFILPVVGCEILQHAGLTEMSLEQHLAALALGTAVLSIPVGACYKYALPILIPHPDTDEPALASTELSHSHLAYRDRYTYLESYLGIGYNAENAPPSPL